MDIKWDSNGEIKASGASLERVARDAGTDTFIAKLQDMFPHSLSTRMTDNIWTLGTTSTLMM